MSQSLQNVCSFCLRMHPCILSRHCGSLFLPHKNGKFTAEVKLRKEGAAYVSMAAWVRGHSVLPSSKDGKEVKQAGSIKVLLP